jgi:CheY-like chemotaxis protein
MTSTSAHPDASSSGSTDSAVAVSGSETGSDLAALEEIADEHALGHRDPRLSGEEPVSGPRPVSLLLYSNNSEVRSKVRMAIGKRLASDLPAVQWTECATEPAVISAVDGFGFDVLILDGEAAPVGGLGLCKQLKDEKYKCPPVLVLTGRPQDAWLATWSRADAAVPHPLDPRALAEAVTGLARRRRG